MSWRTDDTRPRPESIVGWRCIRIACNGCLYFGIGLSCKPVPVGAVRRDAAGGRGPSRHPTARSTWRHAPRWDGFRHRPLPCNPSPRRWPSGTKLCFHVCAQNGVDPCLISLLAPKPCEDIRIDPDRHDFLPRRKYNAYAGIGPERFVRRLVVRVCARISQGLFVGHTPQIVPVGSVRATRPVASSTGALPGSPCVPR